MTATLFKDLIDDLVTLCLGASLDDADAFERAGVLLAQILAHDTLLQDGELAHRTRDLRARIEASHRPGEAPALRVAQQLVQSLEELSYELYSLSKDHSRLEPALSPATELKLPPEADAQIFGEFLSNARLTLDDLELEIESVRQGTRESIAAVKRRIHSLKGESGMLELTDLEQVLHATETFLERPASAWDRADRLALVRDWVDDALKAYAKFQHPSVSAQKILGLLSTQSRPPEARLEQADATAELIASAAALIAEVPVSEPTHANGLASLGSFAAPPGQPSFPAPVAPATVPAQRSSDAPSAPWVVSSLAEPPPSAANRDEPPPQQNATHEPCPWAPDDGDLVVEFLHEVEEHLATVDQVLLETEQSGIDAERVNKLFRAFHTLKGVASFLHLKQFQEVTHTAETMLARLRSGEAIPIRIVTDLVFDATALLRELGASIQKTLTTHCDLDIHPGVPDLLSRFRLASEGKLEGLETPVSAAVPGERLGEILVREGLVDPVTVQRALESQRVTGNKLGQELIAHSDVPPKSVALGLRAQQMSTEGTTKLKEVVKVDLERVDSLVEAIGELVIVESMVSNAPEIRQLPVHLRNYLGQFAKITRELQELGMRMRMVPVRTEFQKMMRIMRDLARRSNKQVTMELSGEGTEMDRVMVEQIADPLVHLIRNAVDHGIEPVEERRAAGKPETGTIQLSACHQGGSIVIEISDDGRGINRERVLAKAISLGIIEKGATLSDAQVYDLLFAPGFSTAQQVTEISGRGVGMDVVKRNIEAVRGRIITASTPGRGTTFRLVLPLTLAIIDGMVIRCGEERFILPTLNIVESLQPTRDMLFSISGIHEHILVRGQSLPLVRLSRILDVGGGEDDPTHALVVIVESLHTQVALMVDEVVMKQQVVIKTLSNELDTSRLFAGAAILSNGRVGLIVNVESLISLSKTNSAPNAERKAKETGKRPAVVN